MGRAVDGRDGRVARAGVVLTFYVEDDNTKNNAQHDVCVGMVRVCRLSRCS